MKSRMKIMHFILQSDGRLCSASPSDQDVGFSIQVLLLNCCVTFRYKYKGKGPKKALIHSRPFSFLFQV